MVKLCAVFFFKTDDRAPQSLSTTLHLGVLQDEEVVVAAVLFHDRAGRRDRR